MALREQHAKQVNALLDLCLQHCEAKHEKTRALARELLNDWDTFWVVLDHPELPLTNNIAAALRTATRAVGSFATPAAPAVAAKTSIISRRWRRISR